MRARIQKLRAWNRGIVWCIWRARTDQVFCCSQARVCVPSCRGALWEEAALIAFPTSCIRAHAANPKVPALSKRRQRPLRRLQRATSNATLCPQRWRLSAVAFFQVLKKSGPKCGEARLRRLSLMKRAEVTGAHSQRNRLPWWGRRIAR